jgi:hypothetical protein
LSLDDSRWRKTGRRALRERKSSVAIYEILPRGGSFDAGFEPAQRDALGLVLKN